MNQGWDGMTSIERGGAQSDGSKDCGWIQGYPRPPLPLFFPLIPLFPSDPARNSNPVLPSRRRINRLANTPDRLPPTPKPLLVRLLQD